MRRGAIVSLVIIFGFLVGILILEIIFVELLGV
jgi:hypothetical protein